MANEAASTPLKKGWKQHLLLSGVPLEYQVARMLAAEEMSIDADFGFLRADGERTKEFSVDMAARWYCTGKNDSISLTLDLLVECKYRSPHKQILFMSDPNIDYSPVTLGGTINAIDACVPYHVSVEPMSLYEKQFEFAYKAVELYDGGANEQDIRHGLQQLRYATPAMMARILDSSLGSHINDLQPAYLAKILVTNAPLRILNKECGISDIEAASSLEDISTEVDSLVVYSDYGPDFEDHFRRIFKIGGEDRLRRARGLRDYVSAKGKVLFAEADPAQLVEAYASAMRYPCAQVSTQFFVTTVSGLPKLVRGLKQVCRASSRRQTKDPAWRRQVRRAVKEAK